MTPISPWVDGIQTMGLAVWTFIKLILIFVACTGAGCVWPRVTLMRSRTVSPAVFAAVNGIGVLGSAGALAAYFHILTVSVMLPVVAASIATGCVFLAQIYRDRATIRITTLSKDDPTKQAFVKKTLRHALKAGDRLTRLHKTLFGLTALLLIYLLTGAFAPDSQQDSQWYHLSMARAWVMHNNFAAWPEVFPSNFTVFDSALYAVSLLLTGDSLDCNLIQWLTGALCVALCGLFALEWFGHRAASWAMFLAMAGLASTAWFVPMHISDDLMVAMFMVGALLLTIDELFGTPAHLCRAQPMPLFNLASPHPPDPFGIDRLAAAGLMMGFAIVSKLTTLGWAVPAWFLLLGYAAIRRDAPRLPWRRVFWALGWAGAPWIVWLVRNTFLGCGNPIYPLARGVIPLREGWQDLGTRFAEINDVVALTPTGIWHMLTQLPDTFGRFFTECGSPLPMIHLLTAVLLLAGLRRFGKYRKILPALAIVGLTQWGVFMALRGTTEMVRLFGQCMPILSVGTAALIVMLEDSKRLRPALRLGTCVCLALFVTITTGTIQIRWSNIPANNWSFRPILTEHARLTYLQGSAITGDRIDMLRALNTTLPNDACVLFADGSYPFYLERKYYWCDPDTNYPELWSNNGTVTTADITERLRAMNITHVIARPSVLPQTWRDTLTSDSLTLDAITDSKIWAVRQKQH